MYVALLLVCCETLVNNKNNDFVCLKHARRGARTVDPRALAHAHLLIRDMQQRAALVGGAVQRIQLLLQRGLQGSF